MGLQETASASPHQGRNMALTMTILGLSNLVLGAAIVAFGPGVIGDPSLDTVIRITGAVFVVFGGFLLWFGHTRKKALAMEPGSDETVQRNA